MSAKSLFHDVCKDATVDTEELQALYASYIKDLNYGGNTPLYKGLIFTNRYLKADYAATAEAQFYYNIELFAAQLKIYIENYDKTEIKKAHKAISNFFKDESLFYPLKRTIPVYIENFTVGVNDDSSRFGIILAADEIAMDGENITIPFREQILEEILEERTRELLGNLNPQLLEYFNEFLKDKTNDSYKIMFNEIVPTDDSLSKEAEIYKYLQDIRLLN